MNPRIQYHQRRGQIFRTPGLRSTARGKFHLCRLPLIQQAFHVMSSRAEQGHQPCACRQERLLRDVLPVCALLRLPLEKVPRNAAALPSSPSSVSAAACISGRCCWPSSYDSTFFPVSTLTGERDCD
jgi:hypothetical protein